MNDTSAEIKEKQKELFLQMSVSERIKHGFDTIEFVYAAVKNRIKQKHPFFTEQQIVAELFKEYYKNDFSELEINNIIQDIISGSSRYSFYQ